MGYLDEALTFDSGALILQLSDRPVDLGSRKLVDVEALHDRELTV